MHHDLLTSPNIVLVLAKNKQADLLTNLLCVEESFLRQRSRVAWLKDGDKNSKFFHQLVVAKKARARITSITVQMGK